MPLYEYRCETDGSVIELMRPMAQADAPVEDPEGKGRHFSRVQSTFATSGSTGGSNLLSKNSGGCCPCGKGKGSCRSGK